MKKIFSCLLSVSIIFCTQIAAAKNLSYEPSPVKLEGTITAETHFGPPNFGENPSQDAKFQVPVLVLDHPVTVLPRKGDSLNSTAYKEVKKLQMIGFSASDLQTHAGQHATVSGTLFQQQTAENYTSVLITVKKVSYAK
jgi:hypothetical protein